MRLGVELGEEQIHEVASAMIFDRPARKSEVTPSELLRWREQKIRDNHQPTRLMWLFSWSRCLLTYCQQIEHNRVNIIGIGWICVQYMGGCDLVNDDGSVLENINGDELLSRVIPGLDSVMIESLLLDF